MADTILTISAAARAVGIPEHTLRSYADKGLVPVQRDTANRRMFTQAGVERAREVVAQRRHGR